MKGFFQPSDVEKDKPIGLAPKCGACGLYKNCETPKMEPYGKGRRGVLVVGDAPGLQEDEQGQPFVGKAGQMLRRSLAGIGYDLGQDAWAANALACHPTGNPTPETKQIEWCRPKLLGTLAKLRPRVVITLGRAPLVSILKRYWKDVDTLERWVGWKIPFEQHWLCPTYHPSYLLRMHNELMDRQFVNHLRQAFDIEEAAPMQPAWGEHIEILYDEEEICEALLEMHRESDWVAVDYETNCLKPQYPKAQIFSCAVSNGERTISYPWKGDAIMATGELLRRRKTRKIASNLKMEEKWTRKEFGFGVANWGWDTMIAAHCLDNRPHICSIKFQALVKLGVASYNSHVDPYLSGRGWYNRIHHVDIRQLLLYGGMDAILEYKVAMMQREEMGY